MKIKGKRERTTIFQETPPKQIIHLSEYTAKRGDEGDGTKFSFLLLPRSSSQRTYAMQASSEAEMLSWIQVLRNASAFSLSRELREHSSEVSFLFCSSYSSFFHSLTKRKIDLDNHSASARSSSLFPSTVKHRRKRFLCRLLNYMWDFLLLCFSVAPYSSS